MSTTIGRFDILRELGRGAQSVVYLAHDPELEREVALKTLHLERTQAGENAALIAEARAVSRLRHAGIVPVFEIGTAGDDPWLVFEYVPGESLESLMRREGALPAVRAVELMVKILDALAHAHDEGVIHRDLKPSNVLIDTDGEPRVMDFGIALRTAGGTAAAEGFSGTPAYMAPEYLRAREIGPGNDVFAAGVILLELLRGRRLFGGDDMADVMRRVLSAPIDIAEDDGIDEVLGALVLRALERDPALRYPSAAAFRDALLGWLAPEEDEAEAEGTRQARQSTVDFLLRRMRHKSDFPALSESVSAINRIASSATESISRLSVLILRDFSLTNKLLRLVNSPHFRQAGGGRISTVSRAIVVLGFDAVRNIAITVLLFEHLQNKANASQLKEEFLRASLAGILARRLALALRARDLEQAFICAMFHNLGRLLAQFYFPEEVEEVRKRLARAECSEAVAVQRVLGIGFEDLGVGIAQSWGFPPRIVDSMRALAAGPVRMPSTPEGRLRVLSGYANELCTAIAAHPPEQRDKEMRRLARRFAASLPGSEEALAGVMREAVTELAEFARVIRLNLGQTQFGQQLRLLDPAGLPAASEGEGEGAPGVPEGALLSTLDTGEFGEGGEGGAGADRRTDGQALLSAGIQDISNALVEDFKLNDVLRMILETMFRALQADRVLLCIRDGRSNQMQGRFGFGEGVGELARRFQFPLAGELDIFRVALDQGADILISDIAEPNIASRIPAWLREATAARTFVLLPLLIRGKPVALIYLEKARAGAIRIAPAELALLRTLRNQAVLAIKQTS